MNELLQETIFYIASYVGIILAFFFSINFFTKGFLFSYLRVKMSRGRLMALRIRSLSGIYFKAGKIYDLSLKYKDRAKNVHTITLDEDCIYNYMGVLCIDFDEKSHEIIKPNNQRTPGLDTVKATTLISRAYNFGKLTTGNKERLILFLLFLIFLGMLVLGFMVFKMSGQIADIGSARVIV